MVPSQPGLQQERDETGSDGSDANKHGASTTKEWRRGSRRYSRVGASSRVTARTADKLKVGASKTGSVCAVDVDGTVAEEASQTSLGRNVKVGVSKECPSACAMRGSSTVGRGVLTELRMGLR